MCKSLDCSELRGCQVFFIGGCGAGVLLLFAWVVWLSQDDIAMRAFALKVILVLVGLSLAALLFDPAVMTKEWSCVVLRELFLLYAAAADLLSP